MPTYRRAYNRRYAARIGQTTRSYPGIYRRPSQYIVTRSARRRLRRYGITGRIRRVISTIAEKKFWDVVLPPNTATSPPQLNQNALIFSLSDIPQNQTDTSRVGDKVTVLSIEIRMRLQMLEILQTTGPYACVRVVVLIWKDDSIPTIGDIFTTSAVGPNNSLVPELGPHWPYNHDRKVKRKILLDQTYDLANMYAYNGSVLIPAVGSGAIKNMRYFIDLKNRKEMTRTINYEGGTTDGVNKIYTMILCSDKLGPSLYWFSRINFIDM